MARLFDSLGSGAKPKTGRKTRKIDLNSGLPKAQEPSIQNLQEESNSAGFSFIEVGPKGFLVGSPDVVAESQQAPPSVKTNNPEPEISKVEPLTPAAIFSSSKQGNIDEGESYADLMKSLIAEFPTNQEGTLMFVTPPSVQIADAVVKLAKEAALCGEVVLVETRENAGTLHQWLGLREYPGWQDVIAGKAELEECLQESGVPGLKVVTAGSKNPGVKKGPRLIARSPRGLVRALRRQHRLILVDGGVWCEESGSLGLARECDGICLLVPASKSGSATVEEILGRIEDSGSKLAGVLVLPNQDRLKNIRKVA